MSLARRLVPVWMMGALAIAYVLMRDLIVNTVPYASILEFPVGGIVFGFLLHAALAMGRPPAPPRPWRRHKQIVRPLKDPALKRDMRALEAWLEQGGPPVAAADVIARSRAADEPERQTLAAALSRQMADLSARRFRETFLKEQMREGD